MVRRYGNNTKVFTIFKRTIIESKSQHDNDNELRKASIYNIQKNNN